MRTTTAARARPRPTAAARRGAIRQIAPPGPSSTFADSVNAPIALPRDCNGKQIAHLSHSSVARWFACPDDWRRHYILRQRGPKAGVMFLGSRVDDAITEFYRRQIAGSTMTLTELVDVFRDTWHSKLKTDGDRIAWEHGLTPAIAERMGRTAVTLTYERLIPRLGTPVAAQRKFEIRLAPALQWTVVGYVDLDTRRTKDVYLDEDGASFAVRDVGEDVPTVEMDYMAAPVDLRPPVKLGRTTFEPGAVLDEHRRLMEAYERRRDERAGDPDAPKATPPPALPMVAVPADRLARFGQIVKVTVDGPVDYKVATTLRSANAAHQDSQATLYLWERWYSGVDCADFRFAQVGKDGPRRQKMSTSLVTTTRTEAQLRTLPMRYLLAAAQIRAAYDKFGAHEPWGFAAEGHWKCMPDPESALTPGGPPRLGRFCLHWPACVQGAGQFTDRRKG